MNSVRAEATAEIVSRLMAIEDPRERRVAATAEVVKRIEAVEDLGEREGYQLGFLECLHGAIPATTSSWRGWLEHFFPQKVAAGFASHHEKFWEWTWSVEATGSPVPHLGIYPRGGGKTTAMELAIAALLSRKRRSFVLYVCAIQDAANQRVQNISALVTSSDFSRCFPAVAARALTPWGHSKGWTQSCIKTEAGQTVLAVGLDFAGARGLNVEGERPDMIVFEDLDHREDTPEKTEKKIRTLTETILPAGARDRLAVAGIQNLVIPDGVFSRMADGRAGFLIIRDLVGPVPAIRGLKTKPEELPNGLIRDRIVGGKASWEGQNIEECQRLIDVTTLASFRREQQHEVAHVEGAMLKTEEISHVADVPRTAEGEPAFAAVAIGVDPPGGRTECGIFCVGDAGAGAVPRYYGWHDRTTRAADGPEKWGGEAVALAVETGGVVYVEGNYGGNMATFVITSAATLAGEPVRVESVTAKLDKSGRAQPMVQAIQQRLFVFVGRHHEIETELTTWVVKPGAKSPNRIDAGAHAFNALAGGREPFFW